jgi:hypothetical protein
VSVAGDTTGDGHPGRAAAVESGVINQHHPKHTRSQRSDRPTRCLRHDVWMAVCDDCRAERSELVSAARKASAAR